MPDRAPTSKFQTSGCSIFAVGRIGFQAIANVRPLASEADPEALEMLLLAGETAVLEALADATRDSR
jgi:hypothetical protein